MLEARRYWRRIASAAHVSSKPPRLPWDLTPALSYVGLPPWHSLLCMPSVSALPGVSLAPSADGGSWALIKLTACSDGSANTLSSMPPWEPAALGAPLPLSCPEGFDAIRGQVAAQAAQAGPQAPVTGVQLRCSSSGAWSVPAVGNATLRSTTPGLWPSATTAAIAACPAGWVISGMMLYANNTLVAGVQLQCTARPNTTTDPLAACPNVPGYTLVPNYAHQGAANLTQLQLGTSVESGVQQCSDSSACSDVLVGPGSATASQWPQMTSQAADRSALQAAVGSAGSAADGCWGTYVRTMPGVWFSGGGDQAAMHRSACQPGLAVG